MSRLLLRPALLLSGLFMLPLLLIRAQPYDDGGLREALTPPEDCPAPCFMGIRPGTMTIDEAFASLDEHPWVDFIIDDLFAQSLVPGGQRTVYSVSWRWNGTQPPWIESISDSHLDASAGLVTALMIDTRVGLGDVLQSYGVPEHFRMTSVVDGSYGPYFLWYPAECLYFQAKGASSLMDAYQQPVEIWFWAAPSPSEASALPEVECGG